MNIMADTPFKPDWVERLQAEQRELFDRMAKLSAFIGWNPKFENLTQAERDLLRRQLAAMTAYSNILGERLDIWSSSK